MSDEIMVPCDHVIARLWEHLDGSLDQLRSDEVQRHLDMCARCFPEYDFRRAYLRFMRRCKTEEVPSELRRQIFSMVLEEEANGNRQTGLGTIVKRGREYLRGRFGKK
ncbi:MAG: zf-HC2 domain-containing protein [Gemmatimonadota bacterium]